jgi:ribosomal protein L11 methyltransferase
MDKAPVPANWLELSATVPREQADRAEQALFRSGALSVTLRDAADAPVLEPAPGETPLWPTVVVTGLFEAGLDPLEALARAHGEAPWLEWHAAALADRAWEREWLRDFRPMRFGRRLAVVPSGMTPPDGAVTVRLDPGLAFGTGTHPTTALCLEWLDGLAAPVVDGHAPAPLPGALVIDYGCGSGILAIAALRLGAAEAIATDLDPQALQATRANAAANGVGERLVACAPGSLPAVLGARKADILVANILAGPLEALLPVFASSLRRGGRLALSGILAGQAQALAAAAEPWFRLEPPQVRDEWVRLSGQRRAAG